MVGVVAVIVIGLVTVVKSVFTDEPSSAATETQPTAPDDPATTVGAVVTAPADPNLATTTILPSVPTDTNRVPTAADPARVLLVGDSEAGGLSPFLERVLDDTGLTAMTTDYKSSTGLVRPDFFDWPARLRETVPTANPDIVVALFGGNDGQGFPNMGKPVDSPEWRAEYGKRVGEVMDYLSADGRTLIWVGVPNARDPDLTANLQVQTEVVRAQVATHPSVVFVDSWKHFTGINGEFAPYAEDPRDQEWKAVRSEGDGFHLNTVGEEILAHYVGEAVKGALRERGAAI